MASARPSSALTRAAAVVLESLEQRRLLTSVAVNFQTSGTSTPGGYLADSGATYANRGNGYSYGWDTDNSANTVSDGTIIMVDTPYKTYAKMQPGGVSRTWEIGLPNGYYQVKVVAGDYANTSSTYDVRVEGLQGPSGTANAYTHWFEKTVVANVTDGKLTITNGAGASDQRISFIQIDDVPSLSTPSTAPANLIARAAGNTAVDLVWEDTTGNEAEFVIQRKQGSGSFATIGTTGGGNEYWGFSGRGFFNDTGLIAGETYTYQVQAKNAAGTSGWSTSASVTLPTSAGQAPYRTSPTASHKLVTSRVDAEDFDIGGSGLGYTDNTTGNYSNLYRRADVDIGMTSNDYFVGWNSTNEWTAYTLSVPTTGTYNFVFSQSRSVDGGTFQIEQNGQAVSQPIQILGTGSAFTFQTRTIEGIQLTGDSDQSNPGPSVITIRILSTPSGSGECGNIDWFRFDLVGQSVAAPTNLQAPSVQSNSVQLTWTDSAASDTTYRIERKQGTGAWGALGSNIAAGTETYTDSTVAPSTAYTYRVIAVSATLGESPASNERGVTTPAGASQTITLNPSADTYVRSGTSSTNYGGATDIIAKLSTGSYHREAYIRFDVAGVSSSASSVKLRVNGWRNSFLSTEQQLAFNVIGMSNTTWSESTTTYDNKPDISQDSVVGTIVADDQGNKWYDVDVTSYVNGRIAAGATAVSFAVVGTLSGSDSNLYIVSREGASKPQLVVETAAPAEVPTAPSGLTATVSGDTVNLSWTDGSSNETGFVVERANNSTFTGKTPLPAVTATSRTDQPGVGTWYYRVVAVNAVGDSAPSNTQSVAITTANIAVTEDTYVNSPSTNTATYGSSTTLEAKNSSSTGSYDRRAFTKFSLSSISGSVTSAKLWVYGTKNSATEALNLEVFAVPSTSWNASTMTYASQPAIATPALDSESITASDEQYHWYELDVTSHVQARLAAGDSGVAFAFDLSASSSAFFAIASAESGANAPYLRLTTSSTQTQPPVAPSGVAVTSRVATGPSTATVTLSWNDNSTDETGFKIERRVPGGQWAEIGTAGASSTSTASYSDTTALTDTAYEYQVRAFNAAGNSAFAALATATTTPPSGVSSVSAATAASSAIVVSWTDNATTESAYEIDISANGDFPSGETDTRGYSERPGTGSTSQIVDDLQAGRTYYFRIRALNSAGNSYVPTTPHASVATLGALNVSHSPSGPANEGTEITLTPAYASGTAVAGTTYAWVVTKDGSPLPAGSSSSYSFTPDDNGSYIATVTATTPSGVVDTGTTSFTVANVGPALTATGGASTSVGAVYSLDLTATDPGVNDTITWTIDWGDGTPAISPTGRLISPTHTYTTAGSFTITISATDGTSPSQPNPTTIQVAVGQVAPASPSGLSRAADPDDAIKIEWDDNSSNDSGFEIQRRPVNGSWTSVTPNNAADDSDYDDPAYVSSEDTAYQVRAINTAGASGWSNELQIPARPATPSVQLVDGSVVLTWSDASAIDIGYRIERSVDGEIFTSLNPSDLVQPTGGVGTYTDSTGDVGETYFYRVRAIGTSAEGLPSPSQQITIDATPTAPQTVQAASVAPDEALITWAAPATAPEYYYIHVSTDAGGYEEYDRVDGTATSYRFFAATDGLRSFRVAAVNGVATSSTVDALDPQSGNIAAIYVYASIVPVPQNLELSGPAYTDAVPLDWEAVDGATSYLIEWSNGDGEWFTIDEVSGTSYTDEYPTIGDQYYRTIAVRGMLNPQFSEPSDYRLVHPIAPPVAWYDDNGGPNERGTLSKWSVRHSDSEGIELDVVPNDVDYDNSPITIPSLENGGFEQPVGDNGEVAGEVLLDAQTGKFTFVPNVEFVGTATFRYRVTDGVALSEWAEVAVDVTNDAPVAQALSVAFEAAPDPVPEYEQGLYDAYTARFSNSVTSVSGSVGASDADNDAFTFELLENVQHGDLQFDTNTGTFIYTKGASFEGYDFFLYAAKDGLAAGTVARVEITDPVAVNVPTTEVHYDGLTLFTGFSADPQRYQLEIIEQPQHVSQSYDYSFSPDSGVDWQYRRFNLDQSFTGVDRMVIQVHERDRTSQPITILLYNDPSRPQNEIPLATPGAVVFTVEPGQLRSVSASESGFVPVGISGTTTKLTNASHGEVVVNSDGSFTYTPTATPEPFRGRDYFTYQLTTSDGRTISQQVQLNVGVGPQSAGASVITVVPMPLLASETPGQEIAPESGAITQGVDDAKTLLLRILDGFKSLGDEVKQVSDASDDQIYDSFDDKPEDDPAGNTKLPQIKALAEDYDRFVTLLAKLNRAAGKFLAAQWYVSSDDEKLIQDVNKLPFTIGSLRASKTQMDSLADSLEELGKGAGIAIDTASTVITYAENTQRVLEAVQLATGVGGAATAIVKTGASILVKEGFKALAKEAAKGVVKKVAEEAASQTARAIANYMLSVLGVKKDNEYLAAMMIGVDAYQSFSLLKKLRPKCTNGNCFAAGTNVITGFRDDGSLITKPIELIGKGDFVLSRDEYNASDDLDPRRVTSVFRKTSDHLRVLTIRDADGGTEVIKTTDEHPFYVEGGGWTNAGDLSIGAVLDQPDGSDVYVVSSTYEAHPEGIVVFNFEVEGDHTYFIEDGARSATGDFGVWSHNAKQCTESGDYLGRIKDRWLRFRGVKVKPTSMRIRPEVEYRPLRTEFDADLVGGPRQTFLRNLGERAANDSNVRKQLQRAGLSKDEIDGLKFGETPAGFQVHRKKPLKLDGDNSESNLSLVYSVKGVETNYHACLTTEQRDLEKLYTEGKPFEADWPDMDGIFVFPQKR